MEPGQNAVRILEVEDDDMSSYGFHPDVHEELVRCHNPALRPAGVARTQRRVRDSVTATRPVERNLTLSA